MKTTIKTIALLVSGGTLLACASAPPPPPPKPVAAVSAAPKADPLEEANARFERGEWDSALTAYNAILKDDPKNAVARFNHAVTLQKLGKIDEAQRAYEGIVSDDPSNEEATLNLGATLRETGQAGQAIKLYQDFLKDQPHSSRVLNNLVVLHREKKEYKKAIAMVRQLLERDQRNIDAYKNLALVYFDQGKLHLAKTILGNAAKMAKEAKVKDADIPVNMGLLHLKQGDKERAMASFLQARDIDPKNTLAHFNIGALALAHRDYELASSSFQTVLKEWPNDPEVNASYGYSLQGLQKLEEAAKQLEKAKSMKNDPQIVYQLMVVFQTANKPKEAIKYAEEYMKVSNTTCGAEDYDGFCGRYNGIKMMIDMQNAPAEPPPDEAKPKATGDIDKYFTETGEVPAEGAPAEGAEGEAAPAEGEAAPAESEAAPEGAKPAEGTPSSDGAEEPKAE